LTFQKANAARIGQILVNFGYVTDRDVAIALAAQRGRVLGGSGISPKATVAGSMGFGPPKKVLSYCKPLNLVLLKTTHDEFVDGDFRQAMNGKK
jgi:hypothetical protein